MNVLKLIVISGAVIALTGCTGIFTPEQEEAARDQVSVTTIAENEANSPQHIEENTDAIMEDAEGTVDEVVDSATPANSAEATKSSEAAQESEEEVVEEPVVEVAAAGVYTAYDESLLANANSGDVVLSFYASWCPSCRTLDKAIAASADDIPSDLTIMQLDYDTETELKKKYGVTYQHTLVQVDADGNMITKWSGGSTLNSILSNIE